MIFLGIDAMKQMVTIFWLLLVFPCSHATLQQSSVSEAGAHKIYVSSFGSNPGADHLRNKLLRKLSRIGTIHIVEDPGLADATLIGNAAMSLIGYYHSNPRIRYRTGADVPVYDVRMTVELKDHLGRSLWSGSLKPRFWGSQYLDDNVVNQAADHIINTFR
jgi:hypothetical protein